MSRAIWRPGPRFECWRTAFRRNELDDDPHDLLRLAARAEFDGHPPEHVRAWLEDQGVAL